MKIKRARHYGFCSGVRQAVLAVKKLAEQGKRASILGQLVHNQRVVGELEKLGFRTVHSLDEVKEGAVIFSAHGVPPSTYKAAKSMGLDVIDTTCKFVKRIHEEVASAVAEGAHLVFLGDPRHREVVGYTHDLTPERYHVISSLEEAKAVDWSRWDKLVIFFQTTLCADDFEPVVRHIEKVNPKAKRCNTICYATKRNQQAVEELASDPEVGLILVVGGKNSANTRRLWEIAARQKPAYLISEPDEIRPEWLDGVQVVGITAGASTPEKLVDEVEEAVRNIAALRLSQ